MITFLTTGNELLWAAMGWDEASCWWRRETAWRRSCQQRKNICISLGLGQESWGEGEQIRLQEALQVRSLWTIFFYSGYHSTGCLCCFMCSFIPLCCWFFLCSMDPAWETDEGLRLIHHETPETWVAVWFWLCICFFPLIWTHFSFHRRHSLSSIFIHRNLVSVPEVSSSPLISPTR